ncbi:acetyl-coenzyme-A carboxylase [Nowakowskiella sp. JEL0078]|nr:acetyl-coenzyme-A carboxylase [Nowakowskiella sp. JEL0078]
MHRNGVSHMVATNDMNGVEQILKWLSYIPKNRDAPLPILPSDDPIDRPIDIPIPTGPYDPRHLLAGKQDDETGEWLSGFFDKDSFMETLAGWAKGVVTGRARLGGIPVGVIAVDTRTTETVIWADPANDASVEQTVPEAGQVWFPNSAFKTAQAIQDFNNGEQLPLILFANWRGFSGGQSDMYREVLKYGAYIVDALRDYKQPVFIYLIGELRGGAWVVVDPTINPDMMEMYAETNSRGGVLEPEGIVEIKFRKPQLLATLERLDPTYKNIKAKLLSKTLATDEKAELQATFDRREKEFLPVIHQAALMFADLHDKPGRMFAKKVVSRVIDWSESREFFYFRLLRRISEESLVHDIQTSSPETTRIEAKQLIEKWFHEDTKMTEVSIDIDDEDVFSDADLEVVRWLSIHRPNLDERLAVLKKKMIKKRVGDLVDLDAPVVFESFLSVLKTIDPEKRRMVIEALAQAELTGSN